MTFETAGTARGEGWTLYYVCVPSFCFRLRVSPLLASWACCGLEQKSFNRPVSRSSCLGHSISRKKNGVLGTGPDGGYNKLTLATAVGKYGTEAAGVPFFFRRSFI